MMNQNNKLLFTDFNPVSKKEWIDKANIDLKGADFNKKLVWKNLNDIDIQPFYNIENYQDFLKNTGKNSSSLTNYRHIIVENQKEGNQLALKAVEEGINGLLFDLKENVTASGLLHGIDLNQITVSFILRKNELEFARDFFELVKENEIEPKHLSGYFNLETILHYNTNGNVNLKQFDKVTELVKLSSKYSNYKAISISGGIYLDAGANQVQEIAYTLNSLVYLIEKYKERGVDVQTIFNNLHVQLAIGSEYFIEIGKFRAFNNLLHEVAAKYEVYKFAHTLTAKTSVWSKSVTDAHTNMLRATTEAMSAILGNVDGVLIDAYDNEFNAASDFSSRIAGNIATILREESYFGKISNPVDGSYYMEEISSKIAERALELFKHVEENGGFCENLKNEEIQNHIALIRFAKIKLLSQRRLVMVGVNKYPNLMESIQEDILSDEKYDSLDGHKVLQPRRATLEIEALRRNTEVFVEQNNFRPVVELTSFGNLAMRKARAAFAYDFMGISGYDILAEKSFNSALEAAKESATSNSDIVVICSSDQDYTASAIEYVKLFRSNNDKKVLLLAGNPKDIAADLLEAGLDGFINIQSDIIKTISVVQNKIQKTIKYSEI